MKSKFIKVVARIVFCAVVAFALFCIAFHLMDDGNTRDEILYAVAISIGIIGFFLIYGITAEGIIRKALIWIVKQVVRIATGTIFLTIQFGSRVLSNKELIEHIGPGNHIGDKEMLKMSLQPHQKKTKVNKKTAWIVLSWTFVLIAGVVGWRDISPHILKGITVLNVGLFRSFIAVGCLFLALCIKVGAEVFILKE